MSVVRLAAACALLPTLVWAESLSLSSPAFANGADIPKIHACHNKGGENVSIPLEWRNAPANTHSFAVIMDDESSPCRAGDGACRHWMVYNLPGTVNKLEANQSLDSMAGVTQGISYSGRGTYDGMCPPGPHDYKITVYALKNDMPLIAADTPLTRSQFAKNYAKHILGSATLTGKFSPW
jgi:Raf kinase inhibitor-like YbhB/YbcL family protein